MLIQEDGLLLFEMQSIKLSRLAVGTPPSPIGEHMLPPGVPWASLSFRLVSLVHPAGLVDSALQISPLRCLIFLLVPDFHLLGIAPMLGIMSDKEFTISSMNKRLLSLKLENVV